MIIVHTMTKDYFKLPRLFVDHSLKDQGSITLETEQTHYLSNVLRKNTGDLIRLFDGENGECLYEITKLAKKQAELSFKEKLHEQPDERRKIHFIFTPIKKQRLSIMIEKMVELGVTDFHPVLTQNTDICKLKTDRVNAQIFEAAEQCERLSIPKLHDLQKITDFFDSKPDFPIFSCIERFESKSTDIQRQEDNFGFLIGPEGGFTEDEKKFLSIHTHAIDLGNTVLRCETAAIKALILLS
ncbi:MAG: RsmE family RNA methyltransferase [Pseudomonadota bacterium]